MIDIIDGLTAGGAPPPPLQITDIGAMAIGAEPWDALVDRGAATLLGFGPQPDECARCNAAARPNRRYLPHALGDGNPWPLHRCSYPATSSMLEPNTAFVEQFQNLGELMQVVAVTEVPTIRLDDVAEARATDLLKLDTQGFELTILENARATLAAATVVQTEVSFVPLYKNQPLFAEVDAFLRQEGFMLHTMLGIGSRAFKPIVVNGDPNRGVRQYLWTDAVYVKEVTTLAATAPAALLKLAVLVDQVYRSVDLAALALRHHDEATGSALAQPYLEGLVAQAA